MAAVAYLARTRERPRASIRVAFTVDEEVGRGAEGFDLDAFGADVAYTLDGSDIGELEVETFSAASMRVTIRGLSVHPGVAKGKLVNAVKLASELVLSLPRGSLSPETTEGREGYVHPHRISGNAEEAIVDFIARDHDDVLLEKHLDAPARARPQVRAARAAREGRGRGAPLVPQHAAVHRGEPARRRSCARGDPAGGVEPRLAITRGGTDGAVLSAQGLPTPNLFTGGQEYHSVREWASVQDMAAAAATIVELAGVWAEVRRASRDGAARRDQPRRRPGRRHRRDARVPRASSSTARAARARRRMAFVDLGDQFIALERAVRARERRALRPRRRRPGGGRSPCPRSGRAHGRRSRLPRPVGQPLAGGRLPRHPVHQDCSACSKAWSSPGSRSPSGRWPSSRRRGSPTSTVSRAALVTGASSGIGLASACGSRTPGGASSVASGRRRMPSVLRAARRRAARARRHRQRADRRCGRCRRVRSSTGSSTTRASPSPRRSSSSRSTSSAGSSR